MTRRRLESLRLVCSCGQAARWDVESADRGAACPSCGARGDASRVRILVPPRPVLTRREVLILGLVTSILVLVSAAGSWMLARDLLWYSKHWGLMLSPIGAWAIDARVVGATYACLLVGSVAASCLAWQMVSRRKTLAPSIVWGVLALLASAVVLQTAVSVTCDRILFEQLRTLG